MKIIFVFTFLAFFACVSANEVEDDWKAYSANPKKAGNPSWVKDIPDFETFKKRWDDAKEFNTKYASRREAWTDYKKLFQLNFSPDEESSRYQIFTKKWDEIMEHNERYALGEIYYPMFSFNPDYHLNQAEKQELSSRPVH